MAKVPRFSVEEKEEDYKDIERMLRAGYSFSKMSSEIGRSVQYCCDIKNDLIRLGKITQKEIDDAKHSIQNRMIEEFDAFVYESLVSGKSREYIAKAKYCEQKEITDSIERLKDKLTGIDTRTEAERIKEEKLNKIKELVEKHKSSSKISIAEIGRLIGSPKTTTSRYINQLIENNEIKREDLKSKEDRKDELKERNEIILALLEFHIPFEIISAIFDIKITAIQKIKRDSTTLEKRPEKKEIQRRKRRKKEIKEMDDHLTEVEREVIGYLRQGYSYTYIKNKIHKSQKELMELVNSLKTRRYISQEIINEAHQNRSLYYKEIILNLYNNGVSQVDIYRTMNTENVEEISTCYVQRTIERLRKENLIDNDKISQIHNERPDSYTSIDTHVLSLLKKGLTVKEMIESDDTGIFTENRVRRSKKRLIQDGKITEKEIIWYQKEKEEKEKKKELMDDTSLIWNYIKKEGLYYAEIAEKMDTSYHYVWTRVKMIEKQKNLSNEEIKRIRKKARLQSKRKKTKEEKELYEPFLKYKKTFLHQYYNEIPNKKVSLSYFNAFHKASTLGYSFDRQEIDILCYVVLYTPELCTEENISTVIMHYLDINEKEQAMKLLNNYISLLSTEAEKQQVKQRIMHKIKECENTKQLHLTHKKNSQS